MLDDAWKITDKNRRQILQDIIIDYKCPQKLTNVPKYIADLAQEILDDAYSDKKQNPFVRLKKQKRLMLWFLDNTGKWSYVDGSEHWKLYITDVLGAIPGVEVETCVGEELELTKDFGVDESFLERKTLEN